MKWRLFFPCIVLVMPVFGQTTLGTYQSHFLDGQTLVVVDQEGDSLLVEAYSPGIFRLDYRALNEAAVPSFSSILTPELLPVIVADDGDNLRYSLDTDPAVVVEILIQKADLEVTVLRDGVELVRNTAAVLAPTNKQLDFEANPEAQYFGTGSRAIPSNRAGFDLEFYNQAQFGYGYGAVNLNIGIPVVVSSDKYALFWDNHHPASLDLDGDFTWSATGGPATLWVMTTPSYPGLLYDLTRITGRQALPPQWALGYIQSRFGYTSQAEAEQVVADLLSQGFPLDALVLDLYWFGQPGDMGNLSWNLASFPDPAGMIAGFQDQGIETVVITETYFTQNSTNTSTLTASGFAGTDPGGQPYLANNFWAGPAYLLDLFQPPARDWFWTFYDNLLQQGVSGFWCDLGEPETHPADMQFWEGGATEMHNVYSLEWARLLHENFPADRRLFNLIRSGFAGMQRYGAIPWSGDVQRSFGGLRAQIPIMLGMGLSGVGYMHSDIGGFTGAVSPELYVRWMQFGCFTPVMRPHGTGGPSEPIYFPETEKNIAREYIRLRHRLMPYTYSLAWENAQTGMPLARPSFFYDDSPESYEQVDNQYWWGPDLLIAPVMIPGGSQKSVFVADSVGMINFWTDQEVGPGQVTVSAPLETLPILVRKGAIVPMAPDFTTMADYDTDTLDIHFYPDPSVAQSQFVQYNDDGKQVNPTGEIVIYQGNWDSSIRLHWMRNGDFPGMPAARLMRVQFHRLSAPQEVLYQNQPLVEVSQEDALQPGTYFWENGLLHAWVNWEDSSGELEIQGAELTQALAPAPVRRWEAAVFPNPGQGSVSLYLEGLWGKYEITLFDLVGREMLQMEVGQGTADLDLSGLPAGAYWWQIKGPDGGREILPWINLEAD